MSASIPTQTISNDRPAVIAAIASAAQRSGVDFRYLLGQARIESGLNPSAKAKTSSATGLFQFTSQTWLATVKANGAELGYGWAADAITQSSNGRYRVADPAMRSAILGLRNNPQPASDMAAEFAEDNAAVLAAETGRTPESVDLYLAHFLGAAGASKFLTAFEIDPDAPAAESFPAAAKANRSIFYDKSGAPRTFADIRNRFAAKLNEADRDTPVPAVGVPVPTYIATGVSLASRSGRPALLSTEARIFAGIEPMPKRLSLDFAVQAYRRLAALDGGRT